MDLENKRLCDIRNFFVGTTLPARPLSVSDTHIDLVNILAVFHSFHRFCLWLHDRGVREKAWKGFGLFHDTPSPVFSGGGVLVEVLSASYVTRAWYVYVSSFYVYRQDTPSRSSHLY